MLAGVARLLSGLGVLTVIMLAPARAAGDDRPARARSQRADIGKGPRKIKVYRRYFRVKGLRELPAPRKVIASGLRRYMNARNRIRSLRKSRVGDRELEVSVLAHIGSFAIHRVDLRGAATHRSRRPLNVLVLGGVHAGSERVGVESALRLAESLGDDPGLTAAFEITVVPVVNPSALAIRSRKNRDNVDVNRDVGTTPTSEAQAILNLIDSENFDVVLDLHGARKFRTGFFLIRGGEDNGVAERIVAGTGEPLLDREGAGRTYEFVAPGVVDSRLASTITGYARQRGVPWVYTVEAPERLEADQQISGTLEIVRSALRTLESEARKNGRAP